MIYFNPVTIIYDISVNNIKKIRYYLILVNKEWRIIKINIFSIKYLFLVFTKIYSQKTKYFLKFHSKDIYEIHNKMHNSKCYKTINTWWGFENGLKFL